MKKIRVSTLLEKSVLEKIKKEAKYKSISTAAIIRQKIDLYKALELQNKMLIECLDVARQTGIVPDAYAPGYLNEDFINNKFTVNYMSGKDILESRKYNHE